MARVVLESASVASLSPRAGSPVGQIYLTSPSLCSRVALPTSRGLRRVPSSSLPRASFSHRRAYEGIVCEQQKEAIAPASGLSCSKKAWRFLSPVSASLSPISSEEDSASGSSEGLAPKIDLNLPRRRLQVSFTCDACGARSQRLINPDAYARGTVFVQCAGCEVYHKLVDNLGLIEEYDFRQETDNLADGADLKGLK